MALGLLLASTVAYSIFVIYLDYSHLSWRNRLLQWLPSNIERDAPNALPPVRAPCQVLTYFQFLPSMVVSTIQRTLDLWLYAFYAQGFLPVILNLTSTEERANFNKTRTEFPIFPTVNADEYELSCFLRWVALAEQGGGLFMDYDLLPMTIPRSAPMRELIACTWRDLTMYETQAPMVTHGSAPEIERWVEYMRTFKIKETDRINGRPHISDMIIAQHAITQNEKNFCLKPALPFFHCSHWARHAMFAHIKRNATELCCVTSGMKYYLLRSCLVDYES